MRLVNTVLFDLTGEALSLRLRRRRFSLFRSLLASLPRPIRVLDLGGTQRFWDRMGLSDDGVEVVILNVERDEGARPGFTSVAGDARDLRRFEDGQFDVVFSNSVIEHVGTYEDQRRMAAEVQRVGRRYFVQTPNRGFPIEPHFLFPGFQFMSTNAQVFLLRHFDLGWMKKCSSTEEALEVIRSVRLLTEEELRQLFPRAKMFRETFMGLTKSFTVYDGWDR